MPFDYLDPEFWQPIEETPLGDIEADLEHMGASGHAQDVDYWTSKQACIYE